LTKLEELQLFYNRIVDLTPLASLSHLKWLFASYNRVVELTPLRGLTNLYALYLEYNHIEDITPLVGSAGLGATSTVRLADNCLDTRPGDLTMECIEQLRERGASIGY